MSRIRLAALPAALSLLLSTLALIPAPAAKAAGPASPPAQICGSSVLQSPYSYTGPAGPYASGTAGLPTFGAAGTDFPRARAGDVLPPQTADYQSWQLAASTVYYLEPGAHVGQIQANAGDVFIGGYASGTGTTLTGNYAGQHWAIDSNSVNGNQPGVTIEYLTISGYEPFENQAALNPDANTGWTIRYDTITHNVPGAGMQATTGSDVEYDCLDANGQYGINASSSGTFGPDAVTGGPNGIVIAHDEISHNDTCDLEGTLTNTAAGYSNYNPVPAAYQNSHCSDQGATSNNGNWGGFKLWFTNGTQVLGNWIHDNYGVGGWADTNNVNTTWSGNYIAHNDFEGIMEEISYNFGITNNTLVQNDWIGGLGNPRFPQAAIYVSESGSDTTFGGLPACSEADCASAPAYVHQSVISGNTLTDNGGGVFLWQNSNRFCGSGIDNACTLVNKTAFTMSSCTSNLSTATVSTSTWQGNTTGSPPADYWDGCMWRTENVTVTGNTIAATAANIPGCNATAWPDCGASGIFSEYGGPAAESGPIIPAELTFHQGNSWGNNTYTGANQFHAWSQGSSANPVTWAQWTGPLSGGDQCQSSSEWSSGFCTGPFGQDAGSTFNAPAVTTTAATGVTASAATLNGTVNPEGQATTYQFQYGATMSYGTNVPVTPATAGSGTSAVNESANLTGLAASTTYHYRITASNTTGTSSGADQTFTTAALTPIIGNTNVQSGQDNDAPGQAEAFQTYASGGTVVQLSLYIDTGNAATSADVGIYTDASRHPGTLLGQVRLQSLHAGTWNSVTVSGVPVTGGATYWLALLGHGGTIAFRDVAAGGGPAENSSQTNLTSLPATWSSGPAWQNAPASFYGSG